MTAVTVNSIRLGVITALGTRFPDTSVYGESIKQDMDPPSFFVKLLTMQQRQELGGRYRRTYPFDIHYFAVDRDNNSMHDMAEQLYELLALVDIGDLKFRGTNMKHEIVDDVLHFFVDYSFIVQHQEPEAEKMQTMIQEGMLL